MTAITCLFLFIAFFYGSNPKFYTSVSKKYETAMIVNFALFFICYLVMIVKNIPIHWGTFTICSLMLVIVITVRSQIDNSNENVTRRLS